MLNKNEEQERCASVYSIRVSDDLNERCLAQEAYLAGMRKQERIDADKWHQMVHQIIDISLCDLSANLRMVDHTEYIEYRLEGGTLDEEDWFNSQCNG